MQGSVFKRLASLVTVRDIQSPLGPNLKATDQFLKAWETVMEDQHGPMPGKSLVWDGDELVGWVTLESFDAERQHEVVADFMERITSPFRRVLTTDVTYFEAVQAFHTKEADWFLVMEKDQLVGTLEHWDLFKSAARLCLFALTLELEETSLEVCRRDARASWESLPPGRQKKATSTYEKRYVSSNGPKNGVRPEPTPRMLLACTMFGDKGTMLSKNDLLPGKSGAAIKSVIGKAEQVRNACAHPTEAWEFVSKLGPKQVYEFVEKCRNLIDDIEASAG